MDRTGKKRYRMVSLSRDSLYYPMTHSGSVAEHRLVMAQHIGRPLVSDEIVMFKDGDIYNTNLVNLSLVTKKEFSIITYLRRLYRRRDRLDSMISVYEGKATELNIEMGIYS